MRMSCNGCRVLRKGCSESCSIRPCLQWIKNPESQANATVFLAKFYGRAGLMNLINAGPDHLRPAIFRSLLYEACGRIVNPIYGSVGLLWSGSWQLCQAAVEAVLKGAPIMQIATEAAANAPGPLLNKASFDIRHVTRDYEPLRGAADLHGVNKATRPRFKRPGARHAAAQAAPLPGSPDHAEPAADPDASLPWPQYCPDDFHREGSDASSTSHPSAPGEAAAGESRENGSVFSGETAEGSMVTSHGAEAAKPDGREAAEDGEVELELELTLGLEPAHHHHHHHHSPRSSSSSSSHLPARGGAAPRPAGWGSEICSVELALDLAA